MPYVVDFHTHSSHSSDGAVPPAEMVASAVANNPGITHMALSDHNTYTGCRSFLDACHRHGIEGFVSAEISGAHPDMPETEFHFLTTFGTEWNESVAKRADLFVSHFNRLLRADTENMFLFLEAAAQLGIRISWRQIARQASQVFRSLPAGQDPDMIPAPGFHHLRKIIREGNMDETTTARKTDLEVRVWKHAGVRPAPTPFITDAYAIYRQAKPAVVLAHPMLHNRSPEDLRPYLREWQREIGLVGLECHYKNVLHTEWAALGDELGLLVSAGSDRHTAYVAGDPATSVPVVGENQADLSSLLDVLRTAGKG
jgi:predicted metal-dependent phosphoesterase TrpH